jgi:hypothetical protein
MRHALEYSEKWVQQTKRRYVLMSAVFSHSRIWQLTSHVYQDHTGRPVSSIPSFCLTILWVSFLLLDRVFALMDNYLTTCFCDVCASLQSPPAYLWTLIRLRLTFLSSLCCYWRGRAFYVP